MGPLDRGGLIQNKSFYSQPVFLVAVLRVSYSLSLICLMTSEDIKHKILSWNKGCRLFLLLKTHTDGLVTAIYSFMSRAFLKNILTDDGMRHDRLLMFGTHK